MEWDNIKHKENKIKIKDSRETSEALSRKKKYMQVKQKLDVLACVSVPREAFLTVPIL